MQRYERGALFRDINFYTAQVHQYAWPMTHECDRDGDRRFSVYTYFVCTFDGRLGVVVGILAYYPRGRGFDSRIVQIFGCMNMSVCIGSGCFYV
jgi:hypothetical protein